MGAIIALVIVLTLSLLVTRLATAALMLTGVSHQLAQVRRLFRRSRVSASRPRNPSTSSITPCDAGS